MAERAQISLKKPEAKRENKVSQTQKTGPSQSISSPVEQILFLQRTIGNQAVGRLIKSGALQAKLTIGQPGDIYEQEADRVAEQVMRMPEPQVSNEPKVSNTANSIQCKCPGCNKGTNIGKEEEEEKLQKKETSGSTHEVTPELESRISAVRGGGKHLPESVRAFYEPRFGADFSGVRVHADTKAAEAARAVDAKAFTVGANIVFAAGEYAPETSQGERLLTHELTHVVQQSKTKPLQHNLHSFSGVTRESLIQLSPLSPQRRLSLDTEWYVEIEPASPIVPIGTKVTFRLKNSFDWRFASWEREHGETGPQISMVEKNGSMQFWTPRYPHYPITLQHTFKQPGHFEISFQGRPKKGVGPQDQPMALTITGSPIFVSVELDVVQDLTRAEIVAEPSMTTYRDDITRLYDPNASEPEIAQTFQRIAVRRGIEIINRNKQEALDLLQLYTEGKPGRTSAQATEEIQRALRLNSMLENQISRLRSLPGEALRVARQTGVQLRNRDDYLNFIQAKTEEINFVRLSLIDAFPAMALGLGEGPLGAAIRKGETDLAQRALQIKLQRVIQDCDTTRNALATEDLHILDVARVINEVKISLGIDTDERKKRAVDKAIKQHRRSGLATSLGLAGAAIILLFVPGIGPYLAATVGLVGAGIAWENALDLHAAAGAGVRGGIVSGAEAGAAMFWAGIETMLAGLDVAAAVKSFARMIPHVPAAADRLASRLARGRVLGGVSVSRAALEAAEETPRIILYRGTVYRFIRGRSRQVHDLGDGVYMTLDPELAVRYAQIRRVEIQAVDPGAPGIVLKIEADPGDLGRIFDFYNNRTLRGEWEAFARGQPGGEYVLRGGPAELYNAHFENWLRSKSMSLEQFDAIIGPEYIRGGSQVCIRNESVADRLLARAEEWARAHEPIAPAYPTIPAPKLPTVNR